MKNISFSVDNELHKKFRIYCVTNDIEMKSFFISCMHKLINDDIEYVSPNRDQNTTYKIKG